MKHTILTCAKFKRLKHRLSNHMECTVIGALESLFLYAGANGPVMSASDVEAICGWTCGEDGVLLDALTDTGDGVYTNFLDVLPDGKVEIHDFWDHAPDCVKTRERQRAYREAKRNAVSHDSHATVTRQSRSCNDKPNQTKPNQVCIRETNVSLVDGAPKKVTLTQQEQEVLDYWNGKPELNKTLGVTTKRKRAISAILKDKSLSDLWRTSIDKISFSDHHLGRNTSGWKISFDWWCRPEKVIYFAELQKPKKYDPKYGLEITQDDADYDPFG